MGIFPDFKFFVVGHGGLPSVDRFLVFGFQFTVYSLQLIKNTRLKKCKIKRQFLVFGFQFTVNKKYRIKEMQDKKTGYELQVAS